MEEKERTAIITEDLCQYALDREDIMWIKGTVPDSADPDKLEYELQLLKIITIGWSLSYFLQEDPLKKDIVEHFWHNMHEISQGLSRTTSLFIGKDINYFNILRSRLDSYVLAMSRTGDHNPAQAIGPEFAELCSSPQDLFTSMAGSRMFMSALGGVRQYLQAAGLTPS